MKVFIIFSNKSYYFNYNPLKYFNKLKKLNYKKAKY
jgi:hypothetical protein